MSEADLKEIEKKIEEAAEPEANTETLSRNSFPKQEVSGLS